MGRFDLARGVKPEPEPEPEKPAEPEHKPDTSEAPVPTWELQTRMRFRCQGRVLDGYIANINVLGEEVFEFTVLATSIQDPMRTNGRMPPRNAQPDWIQRLQEDRRPGRRPSLGPGGMGPPGVSLW